MRTLFGTKFSPTIWALTGSGGPRSVPTTARSGLFGGSEGAKRNRKSGSLRTGLDFHYCATLTDWYDNSSGLRLLHMWLIDLLLKSWGFSSRNSEIDYYY
jgi:hypothetical protein